MGCRASRLKNGKNPRENPLTTQQPSAKAVASARTQSSAEKPPSLPPPPVIQEQPNEEGRNLCASKPPESKAREITGKTISKDRINEHDAGRTPYPRQRHYKSSEKPDLREVKVSNSRPQKPQAIYPPKQHHNHESNQGLPRATFDDQGTLQKQSSFDDKRDDGDVQAIGNDQKNVQEPSFAPGVELGENDEVPPDLIGGSSKRRTSLRRSSRHQRRRRRPKYRNPYHDEDDTLFEVGQVMPTVDFMQEYYESTARKSATQGTTETEAKSVQQN